jgi:hypothetical protein
MLTCSLERVNAPSEHEKEITCLLTKLVVLPMPATSNTPLESYQAVETQRPRQLFPSTWPTVHLSSTPP